VAWLQIETPDASRDDWGVWQKPYMRDLERTEPLPKLDLVHFNLKISLTAGRAD